MTCGQPDSMLAVLTIIIVTIGGLDLCQGQTSQPKVKGLTLEQRKMIDSSRYECYMKMMTDPPFEGEGVFCNRTWDGWGCWGDTPAGSVAEINCPDFFSDLNTSLRASKTCMRDGSWYRHPESNRSWSNYTICSTNTRQHQQVGPISGAERTGRVQDSTVYQWLLTVPLMMHILTRAATYH